MINDARHRQRRRRLVVTGVVLVVGVALAVVLLTRPQRHPGVAASTRPAAARPSQTHGHLVFGMTSHQVLRRTGHPTKKQGNCWLFAPTKAGVVGSISVQPSWSRLPYNPKTQGGLKLCFTGGVFSHGYQHLFDRSKQKWVWFPWPLTLVHGAIASQSSDY